MLYCKNCGNQVEENAKFCIKCFSRLDSANVKTVVDIYELTSKNKMQGEFSADGYIFDHDLSGETVLGMRLIERIGSVAGESYYRACDVSNEMNLQKTIQHIVLPTKDGYDSLLMLNSFNKEKVNKAVEECVNRITAEVNRFIEQCARAEVECVYENVKTYHSQRLGMYHVFIIMKQVRPLWNYISSESIKLRDVIEWAISISGDILKFENAGNEYNEVTDTNLYFDSENKICLGCHLNSCYSEFMYESAYSFIRNIFVRPDGWKAPRTVYSIAMLVYLLLNNMRHPYLNFYDESITKEKYLAAEKLRAECAAVQMPFYARNSFGRTITCAFSAVDDYVMSLSELNTILRNSLNYISNEELNSVVLNINNGD